MASKQIFSNLSSTITGCCLQLCGGQPGLPVWHCQPSRAHSSRQTAQRQNAHKGDLRICPCVCLNVLLLVLAIGLEAASMPIALCTPHPRHSPSFARDDRRADPVSNR